MSRPLVVYSERLGPISDIELALERELDVTVQTGALWTPADIEANAGNAVAIFSGAVEPFDADALSKLSLCLVIARSGIGVNNIDLSAATDLGIAVAVVPDASVTEVSDHALALLLAVERRIVDLDAHVRSHAGAPDSHGLGSLREGMRRLSDLTLGIVGLGRIGRELARKARPIFGDVVAHDPYLSPSSDSAPEVALVDFDMLLDRADTISIHVPLTDSTQHMFDANAFDRMRPGATLVNTSRGGVLDTPALIQAIRNGHLGGAGLDVTENEPISEGDPILECDRVILTGHSAAFSQTSKRRARRSATQAIKDALEGRSPEHLANAEVVDTPQFRIGRRSGGPN